MQLLRWTEREVGVAHGNPGGKVESWIDPLIVARTKSGQFNYSVAICHLLLSARRP
jgi:hypothetical protein